MSIPLVQEATKDAINTSIIAIKRNIERINMLLGLVDSGGSDPDLSGLATKQELQDAITELSPVDEVTVDNMQSVTSNAVAKCLIYSTEETKTGEVWVDGKPIYRRVINIDNPPTNWSPIDLSSLFPNIYKGFLGKMCRIARQGGIAVCQSSFYYHDGDREQLCVAENANNTRICCFLRSPFTVTNIQFEVNYIKTTD